MEEKIRLAVYEEYSNILGIIAYKDNEKPHVHFHFIPRYKNELKIFNKIYKDKHFGYNFWKWSLSKFKRQKDIFTNEERLKIFEMMKEEFNRNIE